MHNYCPSSRRLGLHRQLMLLRLVFLYARAGMRVTSQNEEAAAMWRPRGAALAPAQPLQRTRPVIGEAAASIAIASPRNELAGIGENGRKRKLRESIRLHSLLVAVLRASACV